MDIRKSIRGCGLDSSAQEREQWRALVRTVMNFQVPRFVGNYMRGCAFIVFPRITQLHGDK
jgi:hypothetical protein